MIAEVSSGNTIFRTRSPKANKNILYIVFLLANKRRGTWDVGDQFPPPKWTSSLIPSKGIHSDADIRR